MKRQTQILLIMNEFWAFVSGNNPKPGPTNNTIIIQLDLAIITAWEAKDEITLAFLYMIVDVNVDQNIASARTSKKTWDTLISLYERRDDAHIIMTKAKLYTLRYVETMLAFLSSIKEIRNELNTLGKPASRDELVTATLHALPKEYNSFISSITRDGTLDTLTFNELEILLFQEEQI